MYFHNSGQVLNQADKDARQWFLDHNSETCRILETFKWGKIWAQLEFLSKYFKDPIKSPVYLQMIIFLWYLQYLLWVYKKLRTFTVKLKMLENINPIEIILNIANIL